MSNSYQPQICETDHCTIYEASSDFPIYTKNDRILEVKFVGSILKKFPNQLLDAFPELRKCDVSDTMMKHLEIKRDSKLEWLDASRNQISELSEETLNNIRGIVSLYLSWNKITDLKENLFDDLKDLEVLDLSHNQITILDVDAFYNLTSLRYLVLNHNNLTEFFLNIYKADNLTEVHGNHNDIKYFEILLQFGYSGLLNFEYNQIKDFINIQSLYELKLDENELRSLTLRGKSPKVSANSNQIQSIEISPKANVKVLLLRDNILTDIRNITEIVSIQVLDISSNPIESIEEHEFNKMTNLIHLSLRNTGLLIPKIFLPTQQKLTYLDISENSIRSLDFRSLEYLISLQTLKMKNCSMEVIQNFSELKVVLPVLESISIDGNKFPCNFTIDFITHCLKSGIQILPDPFMINLKSPNVMGISCIEIKELEVEDTTKYQGEELIINETSTNSSNLAEQEKDERNDQWQEIDQTMEDPDINENIPNSSIEAEREMDQQKTRSPELNQSTMALESIKNSPNSTKDAEESIFLVLIILMSVIVILVIVIVILIILIYI